MGTIFNIQRYCLHDGEGIRTTVFFKGCPLRCIWCHNPEGLSRDVSVSFNKGKCTVCKRCLSECQARTVLEGEIVFERDRCRKCGKCQELCLSGANELIGKSMSAEEVMAEVLKDKIYYKTSGGGMTLSGGEPSMQAEFALELIHMAKKEEIGAAVETCGIGDRSFYRKAADMGADFLFDIKCLDSSHHKELTGVENERIISNLFYLFERKANVVIRIPLVPGINDTDSDIKAFSEFLNEHKGKYRYAEVMPYHTFGVEKAKRLGNEDVFSKTDASDDDKSRWKKLFSEHGTDIKIS